MAVVNYTSVRLDRPEVFRASKKAGMLPALVDSRGQSSDGYIAAHPRSFLIAA